MDADTVHQRGLQEVARIRGEMLELVEDLQFSGSLTEFIEYLRSAEQFYVKTPDELLRHAAWLSKHIDGELPRLFATLPRQPYSVKPVPAALAPTYTSGRYVDGAAGTESGTYWVNTHDLPNRPLYGLPALTAHEAVPGHHLQFALAAELDALPSFRSHAEFTAFTEGWALYAEHLGLEMGL
jgi:uncharacterized protein (DUF885 family)